MSAAAAAAAAAAATAQSDTIFEIAISCFVKVSSALEAQVRSLMGFNLGVEIGQLLIVATLVPVLAWLWGKLGQRAVSIPLSLIILGLGGFWLVERTLLG